MILFIYPLRVRSYIAALAQRALPFLNTFITLSPTRHLENQDVIISLVAPASPRSHAVSSESGGRAGANFVMASQLLGVGTREILSTTFKL